MLGNIANASTGLYLNRHGTKRSHTPLPAPHPLFAPGVSLLIAYGPPPRPAKSHCIVVSTLLEKVRVPLNMTYSAVTTVSY